MPYVDDVIVSLCLTIFLHICCFCFPETFILTIANELLIEIYLLNVLFIVIGWFNIFALFKRICILVHVVYVFLTVYLLNYLLSYLIKLFYNINRIEMKMI